MQLIVAEKPSVARDIARVLGIGQRQGNWILGRDRAVTWCVGHLVELEEPSAYDSRWKHWRMDTLPMLPTRFLLRPVERNKTQYQTLRRLMRDRRFSEVINACDAGREGELIFRYAYELAGCRLPVRRLWISSLTDEAIRKGFATLRPAAEYDHLAHAARCRSEADWLVGLNATRAVTLSRRPPTHPGRGKSPVYSLGRVQTPTLKLVVDREKAIRDFRPRDYWEIQGRFETAGGKTLHALWRHKGSTRLATQELAGQLLARCERYTQPDAETGPVVDELIQRRHKEPPPLLFDLTSLQRTANRRYGLSAEATLKAAQVLYEKHKLLTYPRTDSRYLPKDMRAELPKLFGGLERMGEYREFATELLSRPDVDTKPGRRVFDDSKVADHHAIVPTGKSASLESFGLAERSVFDLVARRLLGAFYPDAEFATTEVWVRVGKAAGARAVETPGKAAAQSPTAAQSPKDSGEREPMHEEPPAPPDRFRAFGRMRLVAGWQQVAGIGEHDAGDAGSPAAPTLPKLGKGELLSASYKILAKRTRPPARLTEGALLLAMETAGRLVEVEALRAAMKDNGLGTPATRAATIETLLKRGFIERQGKRLHATDAGIALIDALPVTSLASPELTGQWEARLARICRGEERRENFMRDISQYVQAVVRAIADTVGTPAAAGRARGPAPAPEPLAKEPRRAEPPDRVSTSTRTAHALEGVACPRCQTGRIIAGKRGWGCDRWRSGCEFVLWFEFAGRKLTQRQASDLVHKGKTRKARWTSGQGVPRSGRLVLDLEASRQAGAAVFEPA
ncbi:MAG: DNA topoisomerase [Proteobacteria bacterium]|nr:DNA topoisomerase [Pseudomonadota bacterium]